MVAHAAPRRVFNDSFISAERTIARRTEKPSGKSPHQFDFVADAQQNTQLAIEPTHRIRR
jgi:hypothetical protein